MIETSAGSSNDLFEFKVESLYDAEVHIIIMPLIFFVLNSQCDVGIRNSDQKYGRKDY